MWCWSLHLDYFWLLAKTRNFIRQHAFLGPCSSCSHVHRSLHYFHACLLIVKCMNWLYWKTLFEKHLKTHFYFLTWLIPTEGRIHPPAPSHIFMFLTVTYIRMFFDCVHTQAFNLHQGSPDSGPWVRWCPAKSFPHMNGTYHSTGKPLICVAECPWPFALA